MGKTTINIVPINSVVFPLQTIKLYIPTNSIYFKKNLIGSTLGVCFQKNPAKKFSLFSYLSDIGIVIKVTDETTETNPATKKPYKMIRGAALRRFKIKSYLSKLNSYIAEIDLLPDENSPENDEDLSVSEESVNKLKTLGCKYVELLSQSSAANQARLEFIRSEENYVKLHYTIASYLNVSDEEKCKLLEINNVKDRINKLIQLLEDQVYQTFGQTTYFERFTLNKTKYQVSVSSFPENEVTSGNSLGIGGTGSAPQNSGDELEVLRSKLQAAELPEQTKETAYREFSRLKQMDTNNADYHVQRKYLETLADLPWNVSSEETNDIDYAEKILEKDHAGLENIKKRILEFIAVRMLKKNSKGAILCFQGPPGIGKTSLGKTIADALQKKFTRVALGGVRDEAEVRGHRRTYVGAMPGVFIDAMLKTKTNNPVILLDEIDKIGSDLAHGDPSAALLEVLDPNQNQNFQDHYLGVPFDLSKVLFIATANSLETIKAPLLDRMEVISLSGYTQYEKIKIAKDYLIPKQVKENGIEPSCVNFSDSIIHHVIKHYTSEAGVRNLERTIGSLCRKVAFNFLKATQKASEGAVNFKTIDITEEFVEKALGPKIYDEDIKQRISQPGITIGLAWTQVGGKTLLVEASKAEGKGGIQITGQLGDVMKESVLTSLGWIKSHKELLYLMASKVPSNDLEYTQSLKYFSFGDYDMHIHFPAAAIPKDGPSAGVTITTAIISLLTQVKVRDDIAMTGEISLKGNVLAVGGIKEKCLAAYTHGIMNVILPEQNRRNIEEIPQEIRQNMNFHFVAYISEIIPLAFNIKISMSEIEQTIKYGSAKISRQSAL